jgi:PAS domain S-box-containing protein
MKGDSKKRTLAPSWTLFHAIYEAVNLPITFINNRYEYAWVNACYCHAQGKEPSDLIGNTVPGVWGQEAFDGFIKENLDRCLEGHEVRKEAWINFSAWGRRYCETVYSPYQGHEGGNTSAIVVTYDITDRKVAEGQIENSERRFRNLSEASLEAIVFIEDGIIIDANDALNHLFGYEGEDLCGRPATDFIVPERRSFTDERMRTRTEGVYETLGLRKDGSIFPIEVNPREFEYDGKKLRISAVRDLTDRKKIEKQLRDYQEHLERLVEERTNELKKSEKKYRNIFENAQEGIFQSTPDGRLMSANPALASMLGVETPEELIELANDIPSQIYVDPLKQRELVGLLFHAGAVQNFELEFRRKDGGIKDATMNARAVRDEHGEILFYEGTIQDITEKKLAEKTLQAERQGLEEANTALKVLLKHREGDRKELEERLLANVQQLIIPYVEKLKLSALNPVQEMQIGFIESNLKELIAPFLRNIQGFNFTPRQLEVVILIREGRTTKEIARLLNMTKQGVDIQRFLIRKKLGLNKSKSNLQSYLKSLG